MAQGFSFESFGGKVSVCRDTLYEWERVHDAFSYAKKIGQLKSLQKFEAIGIAMVDPLAARKLGINPRAISQVSWIYQMKCRFNKLGWNPVSADPFDAGDDFEFK